MHIQINYYILESIADDFRMCLIKIGNAEEALDRLEYLYMQSDGKAIDALRLQKVRMLRQLEFYKDRYSAFEQLIRGYIEETTALIRPVRWDAVMTVDAPSFKRAIEAMEEEVNGIIRGPFGTRAPNVYGPDDLPQITLDPEVASRNQDVIQHNRKMIENIRDSSLEAHRKCMAKIARLWEIYYNHFLPFEEKDYEYGQKAIALAHQFATPGDRLEELSGNLHSHVVAPAQSFFTSLSNAIEGTLKFTSDAGEYVEAAIETGINKIPGISFNGEWATEYLNDTNLAVSETVDAIVKEPWIVTEGIADSVSYELAENGPLVGGAAILGSVAPDLLGNKGIPRIRYLGKLKELRRVRYVKKVESVVDDVAAGVKPTIKNVETTGKLSINGKTIDSLDGLGLSQLEKKTWSDLLKTGNDVDLIPVSNVTDMKTADSFLNGVRTELKAMEGSNTNTTIKRIEQCFEKPDTYHALIDVRNGMITAEQAQGIIESAKRMNKIPTGGNVTIWTHEGFITFP
ncbi:MAG: hypothetical protein FWG40_05500 [Peptococcaceae bacterium]|nr:hypothetical protein [Peptococcaceae bacterium]